MSFQFRHAMCNEAFEKWPFADACRAIRQAGYTGIEIAPFTLAENPARDQRRPRAASTAIMQSEGLAFVGLHWLMVSPKGLHVTTPDAALRARSWDHIRYLIDLCADLGPDGVMVFGSPAPAFHHRRTDARGGYPPLRRRTGRGGAAGRSRGRHHPGGSAARQPVRRGADAGRGRRHRARDRQPGGPHHVRRAQRGGRSEPHAVLVDRYFDLIRHVHVNELDGRHCGTGSYDFRPLFEILRRRAYSGWVSLEAFDFSPGAERLAVESLRHLESDIAKLPS